MGAPDLYRYLDYRQFLRDWYQARKQEEPSFSHRAFVKLTGQRSPSLLADVIENRRNLTPATAAAFARALELDAPEASFFAALVDLDQARTTAERNEAWGRVSASRNFTEGRRIEGEAFAYLSHWYIPAIRELATLPGFRADPEWIATTLCPPIKPAEAERALQTLQRLGLLVPAEDGRLVQAEATVTTAHEVRGLAVHNYHFGMLERAREAVERFPPGQRHFTAATVAVPEALVRIIKRELDAVQERILDLAAISGDSPDRVIQVNLNFFPLARVGEEP